MSDMLEDEVDQRILLVAPTVKSTLFRNNSGAFTDSTGRNVRYGLANESKKKNEEFKSSDRIGFTEVLITPEMVGKVIAVFTAIETKRSSWTFPKNLSKREIGQKNFIDFILSRGGIAGFANSVESFKKIITDWKSSKG
jgi:hypothetical protein